MKYKDQVVTIVPFFNEAGRVEDVVQALVKHGFRVIAVDDGSEDGGMQQFGDVQGLRVLRHKVNRGKSEAIRTALRLIKNEYVWLVDADNSDFSPGEYEEAICKALRGGYDMIYFERYLSVFTSKLLKADILLTGDRLIRAQLLKKCFKEGKPSGYLLEMALNQQAMKEEWKVMCVKVSAKNRFKIKKYGWRRGVKQDVKMYRQLLGQGGVRRYWEQFNWVSKLN